MNIGSSRKEKFCLKDFWTDRQIIPSIIWEHWPDTAKEITRTNALQNRC